MGKIVIHQTDDKQTVILTNDAESVTGVYFGEDGEEKTIGAGLPKKLYKVKAKTVQTVSTLSTPVWGELLNYSNWTQTELPLLMLTVNQNQSGLGASGQAIRNNASANVYFTNGTTGDIETYINENTRLRIYIPDEYMENALLFLEEVES